MTWLSSFRSKLFKVFLRRITKMSNSKLPMNPWGMWLQRCLLPNCRQREPAGEFKQPTAGFSPRAVKRLLCPLRSVPDALWLHSALHLCLLLQSCPPRPTTLWLKWRRENDPQPCSAVVAVTLGPQARSKFSACCKFAPNACPPGCLAQKGSNDSCTLGQSQLSRFPHPSCGL